MVALDECDPVQLGATGLNATGVRVEIEVAHLIISTMKSIVSGPILIVRKTIIHIILFDRIPKHPKIISWRLQFSFKKS